VSASVLLAVLVALDGVWSGGTQTTAKPVPPCPLEENCDCQVPGITVRWRAASCMAIEQTDDFEHAGVQRCLNRAEPTPIIKAAACQKNAYWKRKVCRATRDATAVDDCVRDPLIVPRIVAHGAGGER
jgi:hypothetical protein